MALLVHGPVSGLWPPRWLPARFWRVLGPETSSSPDVLAQKTSSSLHTVVESTVGVQSGPGCGASPPLSGCKDEVLFSNRSRFLFVCFVFNNSAQS